MRKMIVSILFIFMLQMMSCLVFAEAVAGQSYFKINIDTFLEKMSQQVAEEYQFQNFTDEFVHNHPTKLAEQNGLMAMFEYDEETRNVQAVGFMMDLRYIDEEYASVYGMYFGIAVALLDENISLDTLYTELQLGDLTTQGRITYDNGDVLYGKEINDTLVTIYIMSDRAGEDTVVLKQKEPTDAFEQKESTGSLFVPSNAKHTQGITLEINGIPQILDVAPQLEQGRLLVPVRGVFEKLNAAVTWIPETGEIKIEKAGTTISLQLNAKEAYVNGSLQTLEVPAKVINGRALIPVRFVAEAFHANVEWNESQSTVSISTMDELWRE